MQCFHEELRIVLNVLDGNVQSRVHCVDIALYTVRISRASAPCLLVPCCATYMYVAIIVVRKYCVRSIIMECWNVSR